MFAVFGTAVSAIVIGGGIYLLGKVRLWHFHLDVSAYLFISVNDIAHPLSRTSMCLVV